MAEADTGFELIEGAYYQDNAAQFTAISNQMNVLHDGRLPQLVGYYDPTLTKPLVAGTRGAARIQETTLRWDGISLTDEQAIQMARVEHGDSLKKVAWGVETVLALMGAHFPTTAASPLRRCAGLDTVCRIHSEVLASPKLGLRAMAAR